MKIHKILISLVFAVLIMLPFSNRILHFLNDTKSAENRATAPMPDFDINELDPFPQDYESYYQDNFFIRNWINAAYSEISRKIFKKSPTDKAMIGVDGWLYIKTDELKNYLSQNIFTEDELNRFKQEIIRRSHYLDSLNCKYYFVVVPTKYSVYPEFLPRVYRWNEGYTRTDQIIDAISGIDNMVLIDLRKTLNDNKDKGLMFRPSDNHWSDLGAYYAYATIIDSIRKDFPEVRPAFPLDSFNIETKPINIGNIAQMMNAGDDYQEEMPRISFKNQQVWEMEKAGYEAPRKFSFEHVYELAFTNRNDKNPTLLLIRDSFGNTIIPFIPAHFAKSTVIFDAWQYKLNKPIVDKERPDVFVQLTMECNYDDLLEHGGE